MVSCKILPGLPPYGPVPESYSATGQGVHREGFVVQFAVDTVDAWVGNFQPGCSDCRLVTCHPNSRDIIVIAGGAGYVVNPDTRECSITFGADIDCVFHIAEINAIVFGTATAFEAIGADGWIWKSRRISWDGFNEIRVEGLALIGLAWDASDAWVPFVLDLRDGVVTGGPTWLADHEMK